MRDLSNVSTLIGSLNNNSNSNMGINLADYASIKNGSYGKLMKAYYSEQNTGKSESTSAKKNSSISDLDTTGLNKMQTESSSLKNAVNNLQSDELWSKGDSDKITKAVKTYVEEYNDVIKQADKVSLTDVTTNVNAMKSMTSTMSKALGKIGVTVATDGTLSVDEDTLSKADTKNIKSLFYGSYSYGGQIKDDASNIVSAASMGGSLYTSNATLTNSLGSIFSDGI